MDSDTLTSEQIADHRAFLQRIVDEKRKIIEDAVTKEAPRLILWLTHELDGYRDSAQEQIRFEARWRGLELDG